MKKIAIGTNFESKHGPKTVPKWIQNRAQFGHQLWKLVDAIFATFFDSVKIGKSARRLGESATTKSVIPRLTKNIK